jgi:hypothetical protein
MSNDPDSRSTSRRSRANTDSDDPMLKRKASDDSLDDEGPSQKNQHTGSFTIVLQGHLWNLMLPKCSWP